MSTKTLRKRIALVAVSAMGFGLLTSVSANAADSISAVNLGSDTIGLVGDFAGDPLAQTATVLSTGVIKLDGTKTTVVSSGAVITGGASVNGSQTCNKGANTLIKPVGAAGTTFTISQYGTDDCSALGTLTALATVTISSSSNAGTPSANTSTVTWDDSFEDGYGSPSDYATGSSTTRNGSLYLYVVVKDVYKATMQSDGALVAEVSSGAVVNTSDSKGSFTTAVKKTDGNGVGIRVDEKTAGTGWNGTVKVSFNGVLIATKSGKITGDITKITATAHKVGDAAAGGNTADTIRYQAYDSQGNAVAVTTANLALDSTSNPAVAATITAGAANDPATGASGKVGVTCDSSGKTDIVMSYVNAGGGLIKSNAVTVNCGKNADTYSASWDKSTYKQGDIATLTIKFLDSKGNPANSEYAVSDGTSADQVITAPQMVRVTEAGGYAKGATLDAAGTLAYTFTVGTDSGLVPGSYNAIVTFPTINTNGHGSEQSAAYTVTSGGTSISNAEVLAAIVKLIASINKQITALQKLLTKKK